MRKSPSQRRFWNTVSSRPRSAAASTSVLPSAALRAKGLSTTTASPRVEGGQPERDVAAVRRRDHGQVQLRRALPDLVGRADHGRARVFTERLFAAIVVPGHDHRQPEPGSRRDERRVEDGAREPVPEEGHIRSHSWNAARRSASSSSSARTGFGSRPNGSTSTRPVLVAPRARDLAVDEERVHGVGGPNVEDTRPVALGKDLRPPRVDEQRRVPDGQEAHRSGRVLVGQRQPREVDELPAVLVLEAPQLEALERLRWSSSRRGSPSRRSLPGARGRSPAGSGGRAARSRLPRSPTRGRPSPRRARTDRRAAAPTCPTAGRGPGRGTARRGRAACRGRLRARPGQRAAVERARELCGRSRRSSSRRGRGRASAATTSAAPAGSPTTNGQ